MRLVGQRVVAVLETKKQEGTNAPGRDENWWYDALWGYVGCAIPKMPGEGAWAPGRVNRVYDRIEERASETARKRKEAEEQDEESEDGSAR